MGSTKKVTPNPSDNNQVTVPEKQETIDDNQAEAEKTEHQESQTKQIMQDAQQIEQNNIPTTVCIPNWKCGEWTKCENSL